MCNLFCNDTTDDLSGWVDMLQAMGGISESELLAEAWSVAREFENVPHYGNIFQGVVLSNLERVICDKYPFLETESYVNALDTHFYVNGEPIGCMDELSDLLASEELQAA